MRERPILMSGPMVRAILEGRKTQTRRIVTGVPEGADEVFFWDEPYMRMDGVKLAPAGLWARRNEELDGWLRFLRASPYGVPGDRLWVRETWASIAALDRLSPNQIGASRGVFMYRADRPHETPSGCAGGLGRWRPSIHMPRWASRITLEVSDVRVERLQEISEEDAVAEGVEQYRGSFSPEACGCSRGWKNYGPTETDGDHITYHVSARDSFVSLWDSINEKRASWKSNPWVLVITFKRTDSITSAA